MCEPTNTLKEETGLHWPPNILWGKEDTCTEERVWQRQNFPRGLSTLFLAQYLLPAYLKKKKKEIIQYGKISVFKKNKHYDRVMMR